MILSKLKFSSPKVTSETIFELTVFIFSFYFLWIKGDTASYLSIVSLLLLVFWSVFSSFVFYILSWLVLGISYFIFLYDNYNLSGNHNFFIFYLIFMILLYLSPSVQRLVKEEKSELYQKNIFYILFFIFLFATLHKCLSYDFLTGRTYLLYILVGGIPDLLFDLGILSDPTVKENADILILFQNPRYTVAHTDFLKHPTQYDAKFWALLFSYFTLFLEGLIPALMIFKKKWRGTYILLATFPLLTYVFRPELEFLLFLGICATYYIYKKGDSIYKLGLSSCFIMIGLNMFV